MILCENNSAYNTRMSSKNQPILGPGLPGYPGKPPSPSHVYPGPTVIPSLRRAERGTRVYFEMNGLKYGTTYCSTEGTFKRITSHSALTRNSSALLSN